MKKAVVIPISIITAAALTAAVIFAVKKNGGNASENTPDSTNTASKAASALEVYSNIEASYNTENRIPEAGGDPDNTNMEGAGVYDINKYRDAFMSLTLVPEDQMNNILNDAAVMQHMMNINSFCSAVFRLNEGADTAAFAESYKNAVLKNQWLCGFPDRVLVYSVDGYILTVYGIDDFLTDYRSAVSEAYPDAVLLEEAVISA